MSQLKNHRLSIQKNNKSCNQIKQQLDQQLQIIRKNLPYTHINEFQLVAQLKRQEQKQANRIEFRSKSYWNSNEKNKMAVDFIRNMQKQQLQDKRKIVSIKKEKEKRQLQIQDKKKREMEQQFQKQKDSLLKKNKLARLRRQEQIKQEANRQKKASQFLQKFKDHNPAHIKLSAQYEMIEEKQQLQRQKILKSIKQSKKHESLNEIAKYIQRYQQSKLIHAQEVEEKKQLEEQQCKNIRLRLNNLYKSRAKSYSAAKEFPQLSEKKEKQQKMMKMMMYSQKVKEQHPPKIDQRIKDELKSSIEQEGKLLHKIQKKKEGQLILLDKNDFNSKEIGLKYLQQIKQYLKNSPRKPQLIPQPQSIKIYQKSFTKDKRYSQKESFFNARKWKGIIENINLTQEQKKNMLENFFALIEDQQQKLASKSKNENFQKQIKAFRRMDYLQFQKAAAKLELLKEF